MQIVFDASILKPKAAGISTFVRALGTALSKIAELTIVTSMPHEFGDLTSSRIVEIPDSTQNFVERQIWRERHLNGLIMKTDADAVIVPAPEIQWKKTPVPTVVVVHDVGPLVVPALYGLARYARMRLLLRPVIRRASGVVCISQFTRDELSQFLPRRHGPVEVIQCGTETTRTIDSSPTDRHTIRKMIIYVGTAHRHKNVKTIIKAFRLLPNLQLVLVGPDTEKFSHQLSNVDARGWVTARELRELLSEASLFVNASLYEGSGLPALEALASGVPVVLSDIPAFREVARNAAVFVPDPKSPQSWADSIQQALSDSSQMKANIRAGRELVTLTTWDAAALTFVRLLDRCISGL